MIEIRQFEKLFPENVCEYAISYFSNIANNERHKIDIWLQNKTFVYKIFEDKYFDDIYLQNIIDTVNDKVFEILKDDFNECDHAEIVFWDETTSMSKHLDPDRSHTAILYLNDDYFGGETVFGTGETIKPEVGKLIMFDGSKIKHGVNKILKGQRYTMIFWFY